MAAAEPLVWRRGATKSPSVSVRGGGGNTVPSFAVYVCRERLERPGNGLRTLARTTCTLARTTRSALSRWCPLSLPANSWKRSLVQRSS
eukprot:364635-Chlamydomonas_euryale.AAC.3